MKSIEEIQADLKQIYAELEERKLMEQESVAKAVDFNEISSKAERYKIEGHPMYGRDEHEKSMYLLLLLSVIAFDDISYETSFSMLYRISHGMVFDGNMNDLLIQAKQMNFERIDEITRLFINDDIKLLMLMECMMIAQSFKKEYKKAMEYIAELCILMKLEKEQIIMISNIARAVLMQDVNEYKCDLRNTYDIFECYIYPLEKSRNLEIVLIRKDCSQCTTYDPWKNERKKDVLNITFSNKRGDIFQYTYPRQERGWMSAFASNSNSNEITIDLFEVQSGHECVYFRKEVKKYDGSFSDILIGVSTNAPNFAYAYAMKKYMDAGGII